MWSNKRCRRRKRERGGGSTLERLYVFQNFIHPGELSLLRGTQFALNPWSKRLTDPSFRRYRDNRLKPITVLLRTSPFIRKLNRIVRRLFQPLGGSKPGAIFPASQKEETNRCPMSFLGDFLSG
jgi:hypothetical protein